MTERAWPEGVEPTPQQLADWLKICTDEERLDHATRVIGTGRRASACLMEGHEGLKAELDHHRRMRLAEQGIR